jgi:hypothetical protein
VAVELLRGVVERLRDLPRALGESRVARHVARALGERLRRLDVVEERGLVRDLREQLREEPSRELVPDESRIDVLLDEREVVERRVVRAPLRPTAEAGLEAGDVQVVDEHREVRIPSRGGRGAASVGSLGVFARSFTSAHHSSHRLPAASRPSAGAAGIFASTSFSTDEHPGRSARAAEPRARSPRCPRSRTRPRSRAATSAFASPHSVLPISPNSSASQNRS